MFSRQRAMVLALVGLAGVAGCGAPAVQVRQQRGFPEEVLRDPVGRLAAMQQMRMQILRKTVGIEEERYQGVVRPLLGGQLVRAGFTADEADQVLAWVDEARADRARVSDWWSSLTRGPGERHSMR